MPTLIYVISTSDSSHSFSTSRPERVTFIIYVIMHEWIMHFWLFHSTMHIWAYVIMVDHPDHALRVSLPSLSISPGRWKMEVLLDAMSRVPAGYRITRFAPGRRLSHLPNSHAMNRSILQFPPWWYSLLEIEPGYLSHSPFLFFPQGCHSLYMSFQPSNDRSEMNEISDRSIFQQWNDWVD